MQFFLTEVRRTRGYVACIPGCNKGACSGCKWTPGTFLVFCSCRNRKLLGFALLDKAENPLTMLQLLYTRWPIAPKLIWYDNGCNEDRSCTYRVPDFFRLSKFLIDCFHDVDHSACSDFFKFDSFDQYQPDYINTQLAEQSNRLLKHNSDFVTSVSLMKQTNFMLAFQYWMYLYNIAPRDKRIGTLFVNEGTILNITRI